MVGRKFAKTNHLGEAVKREWNNIDISRCKNFSVNIANKLECLRKPKEHTIACWSERDFILCLFCSVLFYAFVIIKHISKLLCHRFQTYSHDDDDDDDDDCHILADESRLYQKKITTQTLRLKTNSTSEKCTSCVRW